MSYMGKVRPTVALTSSDITDGAVIEAKIGGDAVTSAKINDGAIATAELSADAVTPAKMADSAFLANKNVAINGAMQVSQRGTSESSVTTAQYADAPDRWYIQLNGAGTWTVSQSTTAPNGFSHSYKFDCTTADASLAASDRLYLAQKIEGQNLQRFAKGTADAEKYTVSFWARSSKTGTYIVGLWDADNARQCSQSYSIGSADTWTKIEVEFPADTTGGITYDNSQGMQLIFYLAAGTDYSSGSLSTTWESSDATKRAVGQVNVADSTSGDWYITGIQLEVGDTATPFEYKTFGQELAACQRYYREIAGYTGVGRNSPATIRVSCPISPEMRATPSVALGSTNNFQDGDGTVIAGDGLSNLSSTSSAYAGTFTVSGTAPQAHRPYIHAASSGGTSKLDAEL